MIFISDVHYQIEYLNSLPKNKGPIVILGDLINWIDYRDGQGIAMDVFGKDNVKKLINLRKLSFRNLMICLILILLLI